MQASLVIRSISIPNTGVLNKVYLAMERVLVLPFFFPLFLGRFHVLFRI